jgi:hypothetical protein
MPGRDGRETQEGREGLDAKEERDGQNGQYGQEKNDPPRDDLDETLEETFPASDAPANTPETGIRIDPTTDEND